MRTGRRQPTPHEELAADSGLGVIALAFCLSAAPLALPAVGLGRLTGVAYLVVASVVAWWLSRVAPPAAIVHMIAVWATAPLFRRLGDWASGTFTEQGLALYAPPVVTGVVLIGVGVRRLASRERDGVWLVGFAAALGLVVGSVSVSPAPAVFGAAEWLAPVAAACAILVVLRTHPGARDFVVGGLAVLTALIAGYGLYQYFTLPPWDAFWLRNAPINSQGIAEVGEFRIFSTSNSTGVFAIFLAFLLLILVWNYRAAYAVPLTIGTVAVALTLVRASWAVLAIGLLVAVIGGRQRRGSVLLVVLLATGGVAVLPFLAGELGDAADQALSARLGTLTSLTEDESFQDRSSFADQALGLVLGQPLGHGFGSSGAAARSAQSDVGISNFDSGLINLPYTLGWLGMAAYVVGMHLLLGQGRFAAMRWLPVIVGLLFVNILVAGGGVAVVAYMLLSTRVAAASPGRGERNNTEAMGTDRVLTPHEGRRPSRRHLSFR